MCMDPELRYKHIYLAYCALQDAETLAMLGRSQAAATRFADAKGDLLTLVESDPDVYQCVVDRLSLSWFLEREARE